jgi:valyl-tRNA synthetase
MIDRYSADAIRYWAASTGLGKDSVISEEKIRVGSRLVTKLWNVARFSEQFLAGYSPPRKFKDLVPIDRWVMSQLQGVINRSTNAFDRYDYVTAKNETEEFFWHNLADNYLEMVKYRLYSENGEGKESATFTLYHLLLNILKLFAPILPHVTDQIFRILFAESENEATIHIGAWPREPIFKMDKDAELFGEVMVKMVTAVRRYKSEHHLPLSTELSMLTVATKDPIMVEYLKASQIDLRSVTRARIVEILADLTQQHVLLVSDDLVQVAISP